MRKALLILLVLVMAAGSAFAANGNSAIHRADGEAVPGQYIVQFHRGPAPADVANQLANAFGARTLHVYEHALAGAAFAMNERQARGLAQSPFVSLVEEDQVVYAVGDQSNPTWGLDRVDERDLPLDGNYHYDYTGSAVTAYILDTGIRTSHNDFGGRAYVGYDAIGDGWNGQDCNGHGTHVAGTVGGSTWGVAKGVDLVAVRVLDCNGSGTLSGVIAGIDWVTANAIQPAVANMSLGGGASSSIDDAVNNSVASGVFYAVAAGNESTDACTKSPARAAEAYTVASSTSSDSRSSFSNYGSCVDIFAPGSSITSAWHTSNTATNTISGTSMASPHVAGGAALVLAQDSSLSPDGVKTTLTNRASANKISNAAGSPNLLLYTLDDGGGGGGGGGGGETTVYFNDFDDGSASGWNKSSASNDLWRLATDCVSAYSGSYTIAFSRSGYCDYDVGTAEGWARSPVIDLSGSSSATLKFVHFWETESYSGDYDQLLVQVSSNSGSSWTTVLKYNSADSNPGSYVSEAIDVSSYTTSGFRVRFYFDSVDGSFNDYRGWYVDNVEVTAN